MTAPVPAPAGARPASGAAGDAPQSMTGYATVAADTAAGRVTVELRSVNSRFLDLAFRIPDALRGAEGPVREAIVQRVRRGKLECRISLAARTAGDEPMRIDEAMLERLGQALAAVRAHLPEAAMPTGTELLRWPGVLAQGPAAAEEGNGAAGDPSGDAGAGAPDDVRRLVGRALDEFVATRRREGTQLVSVVRTQLDGMRAVLDELAARVPEFVAFQQRRLEERLREALSAAGTAVPLDQTMDRVRQEVVALGLRADIAEEIDRLGAHVEEARRVVAAGGAVGKRLDFLAQEMNREANTIGSKSAALEQTRASMALKLLIEQMREQAQNLE